MKAYIYRWDWKESPDIEFIFAKAKELKTVNRCESTARYVETNSDEFAVVIGPVKWTKEQCAQAYEKYYNSEPEEEGYVELPAPAQHPAAREGREG